MKRVAVKWQQALLLAAALSLFGLTSQAVAAVFVIGETKIASHAALDADQEGFAAGLADSGFVEGQNLRILREDANGDMALALKIAHGFVDQRVDLIHAISTPSSVAALSAGSRIPLVFSSVTDPVSAGIVNTPAGFRSSTGNHITGVSDLWPVAFQMRLYQRMHPQARVWGTIYNPAEPNSRLHVEKMREAAGQLGLTLLEATVSDSAQVPQAAESLLGKAQAFMITSDNTTVQNLAALVAFCERYQLPLFAGDVDSVRGGAVAAYGMDYFLVGYAAGRKAALILQGVKPGDIPWGPLAKFSFVLNVRAAERQGVEIPGVLLEMADEIIE